jgi:hypothetical protein
MRRARGNEGSLVTSLFVYLTLVAIGLLAVAYAWLAQPQGGWLFAAAIATLGGLCSGLTFHNPFFGGEWRYDGSPLGYLLAYHVVSCLAIAFFDRWLLKRVPLFLWRVAIALPVALTIVLVFKTLASAALGRW